MAHLKGLVRNHQNWAEIGELELIHARLDDEIADVRLMRGPWCPSRIPPEILCEIFHFYLASRQDSAWTISQVCRAWRRIAFGCPTLWNTLHITSRALNCSNAYRSRHPDGWDCHVTDLQAARAIRRTREAALWIELELNEWIRNPSAVLGVLRVVAGQNLARWRSLVWLDSTIGIGLTSVLRQVFLPTQGMTSLQQLLLPYKHCDLLLPALIAGVPNLSSLEVKLEAGVLPTMLMDQPWLGQLKGLTLEFYGRGHPQLGQLVGKCKALEKLSLRSRPHSLVSGGSLDSAGWPLPRGLRTILLHTHANFWPCASSVSITTLALRMEGCTPETLSVAPRSISLPSLTKLECSSHETTFTAGYLLDAPKIRSMYIYWSPPSSTTGTRDIFSDKPWGIYPIKVFLQIRNPDRTVLQDLFVRLSKTKSLNLHLYSTSVDPLRALVPVLDGHNDAVVCPNLYRVEFEFKDKLPNSEIRHIDGIIQAIRDTRGQMGIRRPSVNVSWRGCYSGVQK